MKRNPNFPLAPYLSIVFAIIVLSAGCGTVHALGDKLEQKPPGKLHSVTITWIASTSPVIGYNVYRTRDSAKSAEKLTPQPISATQFTDTSAVGGHHYTYFATSVDAKGVESSPSAPTAVTVPYP